METRRESPETPLHEKVALRLHCNLSFKKRTKESVHASNYWMSESEE